MLSACNRYRYRYESDYHSEAYMSIYKDCKDFPKATNKKGMAGILEFDVIDDELEDVSSNTDSYNSNCNCNYQLEVNLIENGDILSYCIFCKSINCIKCLVTNFRDKIDMNTHMNSYIKYNMTTKDGKDNL